ncbi:kinase-like protein [Aulographum hederae CBS 113979]|uniref:non-specific serine/threonine protein kinase n=1 Tax=Aulographum hederae CBS 113979 TaxID=1176131 RepID=A0A6G1GRD6_9PEZI|nr:kinase-like protein [Aulographum hederae CBS 113979]
MQDVSTPTTPSITTIETTAATKVFLETHFNTLLSPENNPRSQRRRRLEERFHELAITCDERDAVRREWESAESDYLRQVRKNKSKTLCKKKDTEVSVAGYEVIRVLGKGSFGVVRLVREKSPEKSHTDNGKGREIPILEDDTATSPVDGTITASRPLKDLRVLRKQVYAMKVIRKSDMLRNAQEGHLRAERDLLVRSAASRWVVPLIASFQDDSNLYLVMEYMVGGDFLGLLLREDILDEPIARWYIAEMIICVEEAHRMHWIHRDVKPDNFLIGAGGHLKISDFGLAFDGHWSHSQAYYADQRLELLSKFGIEVEGDEQDVQEAMSKAAAQRLGNAVNEGLYGKMERPKPKKAVAGGNGGEAILDRLNSTNSRRNAKSIVGTSQYMAPEVIRGEVYDGRCDWWSVGIILFECLYGHTPFFSENRQLTKEKILRHYETLDFPTVPRYARPQSDKIPLPHVSFSAIDLMQQILQEKDHRLSSRKYRDNDLSSHVRNSRRNSRAGNAHHHGATRYPTAQSPNFVFADDAEAIKLHPFFGGVRWDRMTAGRETPPFVPRVGGGQSITKYFEDEEDILSSKEDVAGSSGSESDKENMDPLVASKVDRNGNVVVDVDTRKVEQEREEKETTPTPQNPLNPNKPPDSQTATPTQVTTEKATEKDKNKDKKKPRKEKKRPRDRILRDPQLGRKALDVRKKRAFLGYTYRRPEGLVLEDGWVERSVGGRRASILPGAGVPGMEWGEGA